VQAISAARRPRVSPAAAGLVAVGALGGIVLTSWLLLVVAHADDTYHLSHSSGVLTALASFAADGTLYPPLYDGESFGGTRYMPIQLLVHAGLAELTGEYVVAGKLVTALAGLGLAVAMLVVLRTSRCPWPIAIVLVGAVYVTSTALWVTVGIRADALPVALQLLALALVARSFTTRRAVGAGALCALALASKLSAVWAPAAIVVWLLRHRRSALPWFGGAFVVGLAVVLGLVEVLSAGRMSDNIFALAASDRASWSVGGLLVETPRKLVDEMQEHGAAVWPLVPLAAFGTALAVARRRLTIFHIAFVFAFATLWFVLGDEGADFYHLIDLEVMAVVVVGILVAEALVAGTGGASLLAAAVVTLVAWNVVFGYHVVMAPDAREALSYVVGEKDDRYRTEPLAGTVGVRDRILAEDAYVPVSLGQPPVVLDSFMLARSLRSHPDWERELVRRLDDREFDKVVLMNELDVRDYRYRRLHFGADVADSIARSYRLETTVDDLWRPLFVYVPRR
jgi:hypothetical protein